jgi:hypothetical protein
MNVQTFLALVREHLKQVVPRQQAFLGISFPDTVTTKKQFLVPIDQGIYRVRQDRRACITRSGVVRVGAHFLTLDYGPFSAFRLSNLRQNIPHKRLPAVLPLWSHEWMGYYHWLIDVAPKLAAAKQFFGSAVTELYFLFPGEFNSYQTETVEALGLSLRNIVNLHRTGSLSADTIYAMPLPGFTRIDPRLHILRSCLSVVQEPCRRLYISRGVRRRIKNEAELFSILDRAGFEFVPDVPRPLIQQIELFAKASYIVAPHGAGLSNIIWCSPRTRVLELANSRFAPPFFKTLASECGLIYDQLLSGVGTRETPAATPSIWRAWAANADDIIVDLGALRHFLSEKWAL